MSLFNGFTIPSSIKWSRLGSLTLNKWIQMPCNLTYWSFYITMNCCNIEMHVRLFILCSVFGLLSPVSEMSIFMSARRRWFSVANHGHGFFPRQEKCWRIEAFGATFIDQIGLKESQSSSLLSRFSSDLVPRCLVFLDFWFLLNEHVYCNVLVDTTHVHMQRHTLLIVYALAYLCTDLYL